MDLKIILVFVIIFLIFQCSAQRDTLREFKEKRKKPKKGQRFVSKRLPGAKARKTLDALTKQLVCMSCVSEFSTSLFDPMDLCYNPWSNVTVVKDELLTVCPPFSRFCKVELVRHNGVLGSIVRGCGDSICNDVCFQKGYGVEKNSCTYCCNGIDLDEFSQENAKSFICPTRIQNLRKIH